MTLFDNIERRTLRFSASAQRYGEDAVRSARYWIKEARAELRRPPPQETWRATPLELCVNRAQHAIDALMMALGVSERPPLR